MTTVRQLQIVAILLVLSCGALDATTYYAATNGVSGNTGLSTNAPWPLDWALSHAGASNTIVVMPGTFNGHYSAPSPYQTILAQTKWTALIYDDSDTLPAFSVFPSTSTNVTVDGLQITGSSKASGVYVVADNATIQNCWIHHCGTNNTVFGPGNGIEAHDLTGTSVLRCLIEWCGTFTNGGWGSAVYMNGTNITVSGNVFRYNQGGVQVYRDPADNANEGSLNVTIANNLVYGNFKYEMIMGSQFGRTYVMENNAFIHTNGFNSVALAYIGQSAPCLTLASTNNIFYNVGGTFQAGCGTFVGDYNLMNSNYWVQANSVITNSVGFLNSNLGLYWLTQSSPARLFALASACATNDFFGNAQTTVSDVGPFQYSTLWALDTRTLDPSSVTGADYWSLPTTPCRLNVGTWILR